MKLTDDLEKIRTSYPAVQEALKVFPGVIGLGVGFKEVRGQLTNEIAWRVYVKVKQPAHLLKRGDVVPRAMAGFPTDIISKLSSRPNFGEDHRDLLVPGIKIESDFKEGGTLGCFARLNSDNSAVLLGSSHVLYGPANKELDVGQPKVSCCCWCKCKVIGRLVGDGRNAFNNVTVEFIDPDEPGTPTQPNILTDTGSEIDCAVARLNGKRPFTNEIPFIGMIAGTPPAGDFGVKVGDEVEKVGFGTGHTKGIVLKSPMLMQRYKGGPAIPEFLLPIKSRLESDIAALPTINQLWIVPKVGFPDFVSGGDSGAVVVNKNKQVIGLVVRQQPVNATAVDIFNLPPHVKSIGIVNPIHKVLSALNIRIPANLSSTGTTHGELIEMNPLYEEERRFQAKISALQAEVKASSLGKYAFEQLELHGDEVARIFNQQKRVAVTWRRHNGPAFAAHCLKTFNEPNHVVPREIEGVSRARLLSAMAEILKTHASTPLKETIETNLPLALNTIDEFDSLNSLLAFLRTRHDE